MQRVAELLRDDAEMRIELEKLERALRPLEDHYQPPLSPPPDLVSKTMSALPPLPIPANSESSDFPLPEDALAGFPVAAMNDGVETPARSGSGWADWMASALSAAVLLALILPSLAEGRFESRRAACQDQLRQFGTALTQFVNRDEQSRLPAVAKEGPEAFAGIYAVRLNEAGLLGDVSSGPTTRDSSSEHYMLSRWCPSLGRPTANAFSKSSIDHVATIDELHHADHDTLRELQQLAGGHYAYTLGVVDGNDFGSPKFESRSSFAVMSDSPGNQFIGSQGPTSSASHGRLGVNILYEDGRVQFVSLSSLGSIPDHPWFNYRGDVEAGVNIDDASLAPSWRPPFANVRQR
ncbi:hypothetical protein Q31b_55950 [Novipirellula aureliae]|uniref:DUF1559 domain-containing protein n=2 Tax=Novipirellula aureliae TaxID=2527966 RepID=A0A5C6DDZ7_9BACT|nr:hypothetical protein Q31b_55950 [Novipirellula aureliae]